MASLTDDQILLADLMLRNISMSKGYLLPDQHYDYLEDMWSWLAEKYKGDTDTYSRLYEVEVNTRKNDLLDFLLEKGYIEQREVGYFRTNLGAEVVRRGGHQNYTMRKTISQKLNQRAQDKKPKSWWYRFFSNPWTIGIGVTVIGGLIVLYLGHFKPFK